MLRNLILLVLIVATTSLVAQDKKLAPDFFEKGEAALDNKAYKTALAHFNECLRHDPYFMQAYRLRAMAREQLGDAKGALNDYNIFLETHPDHAEVLFTRGVLRYQNRQWAVAREDFLKLLTLPAGETNQVFFETSTSSGSAKRVFTAQGNIRPLYFNYLGLVDMKLKKYTRAISALDSAIKLNPDNTDYLLNRGIAYQMMGDTVKAINDYQKTLVLDAENSLARHNLASLSLPHTDPQATIKLLNEAIEKNPKESYSYAQRGFVKIRLGDFKGAQDDYSVALKLDPTDAESWYNRAIAREKLKDSKGALTDYTQALKINDKDERIWLNRGNLLMAMGNSAGAIEDYTVAIRHSPEYSHAFYNRALAQHKLANPKEACADLQRAQRYGMTIEKKVIDKICPARK